MNTTNMIAANISKRNNRESKNAIVATSNLFIPKLKSGITINLNANPTAINKTTNINNHIPLLSSLEPLFAIEVYHSDDRVVLNKVSSVKAPLRFTVLWAAEKGILREVSA